MKQMNKFISLTKSANKLTNDLSDEISEELSYLKEIIQNGIKELNDLMDFINIKDAFPENFELNAIYSDFVSAIEYLSNELEELKNDNKIELIDKANELKGNIDEYKNVINDLLNNIYSTLNDLVNIISSKKSLFSEIALHLSNNTDKSYFGLVNQSEIIFNNYYIDEINNIQPQLNKIFEKYHERMIKGFKDTQKDLNYIKDNLISNKIKVYTYDPMTDFNNVIKNIQKAENTAEKIIEEVEYRYKSALNYKIKNSGYFQTQNEIDFNKEKYDDLIKKTYDAELPINNTNLIDNIFEENMGFLGKNL